MQTLIGSRGDDSEVLVAEADMNAMPGLSDNQTCKIN
jgi:hypothetical protein